MKTLTVRQVATIKRVANSVASLVIKKNKLAEKIDELNAEYNDTINQIDAFEQGTKMMTGGFISEQLIDRVVEVVGTDENGKELKQTKYVPKKDVLVFDEEKKVYNIIEPSVEMTNNVDTTCIDANTASIEMEPVNTVNE